MIKEDIDYKTRYRKYLQQKTKEELINILVDNGFFALPKMEDCQYYEKISSNDLSCTGIDRYWNSDNTMQSNFKWN